MRDRGCMRQLTIQRAISRCRETVALPLDRAGRRATRKWGPACRWGECLSRDDSFAPRKVPRRQYKLYPCTPSRFLSVYRSMQLPCVLRFASFGQALFHSRTDHEVF